MLLDWSLSRQQLPMQGKDQAVEEEEEEGGEKEEAEGEREMGVEGEVVKLKDYPNSKMWDSLVPKGMCEVVVEVVVEEGEEVGEGEEEEVNEWMVLVVMVEEKERVVAIRDKEEEVEEGVGEVSVGDDGSGTNQHKH